MPLAFFLNKPMKSLSRHWLAVVCRLLLGGVFVIAGIGKLPHGEAFAGIVAGYGILPDGLAHVYAAALPWAEIAIGILLVLGIVGKVVPVLGLLTIASFMTANIHALLFGTSGDLCGCFGDIVPLTHAQSLAANIVMAGISVNLLFHAAGISLKRVSTRIVTAARPVGAAILVLVTLTVSLPAAAHASTASFRQPPAEEPAGRNSIDVGRTNAGNFFIDPVKPTLMYFYSEDCGNCREQAPVIDALEHDYGNDFNFLRIDSAANREMLKEYSVTRVPTMLIVTGDESSIFNRYVGSTSGDVLLAGLIAASAALTGPQPDEDQEYLSARELVSDPSDNERTGTARITGDIPDGTEIANLVAPYGQTLDFGGSSTFGPNEPINISVGTHRIVTSCADGYNDTLGTFVDIYIVPSGSVGVGSGLTDVTGSRFIPYSSSGYFFNETIAYTYPGGQVYPGTYAIVYDECQDGDVDTIDGIFDPAFTVEYHKEVPPLPASFWRNKTAAQEKARVQLLMAAELQILFDSLDLYNDSTSLAKCALNPAPCLAEFAADKMKEAIMEAAGLKFDVRESIMTWSLNLAMHFLSIAADPPNPDFQHLIYLSPLDYTYLLSDDALLQAMTDLGNAQMVEAALAEALLAALESYQGADEVSDNEWGLIHARAIKMYAQLLADQTVLTNQAIAALDAALAADTRSLDDFAADLAGFRAEIEQNGIPSETTLYLKNMGLTDDDIQEILDAILAMDPEGFTVASFRANLASLVAANDASITELTALATEMQTSIEYLDYYYVGERSPLADAGGPYTVAEGSALILDGSGSLDPDGSIVSWEWDIDLDGEYDDTTGISPVVIFDVAFSGLIGLQVTDNISRTSINYVLITVTEANSGPVIDTYSPDLSVQEMALGDTIDFSLSASDPDSDPLTITWFVGNTVAVYGNAFSFQPSALADAGLQVIRAEVSDNNVSGGTAVLNWAVNVLAEDADGDGWRANVDCNEAEPNINPGMTEITGNGIDDDCNPLTSDVLPIPAFSFTPGSPMAGDNVFFTDESTDPDGYLVAWNWDFGDGETSTIQHPVHVYARSGVFTVTLTVTEECGNTDSLSKNIAIAGPPNASFTVSKEMSVARLSQGGSIVDFSSVYSDQASYQPVNLIDESTSSGWRTAAGQNTNQWMTIDLAGDMPHLVSKVKFYKANNAYNPRNFEVRASLDGTGSGNFTTVLTGALPEGSGWFEFDITPMVNARYVQLYVIDTQGSANYFIVPYFDVLTPGRDGGIVSMVHGKPASIVEFSSQSSSSNSPASMLDEISSYWATATGQTTNQWVKIELGGGQSHVVSRVVLAARTAGYGIKDFEIRVSNTSSDNSSFTTVFTGTTANDVSEQEFTFTPVQARYVMLYAINNHGSNQIREATFKMLATDGANLASSSGGGAFIVDYSSFYSNNRPELAIDYDTGTYWRTVSGDSVDQWLTVRLLSGSSWLIDRVQITALGGTAGPKDYEIRVSNTTLDDAAFTTVYSGTLPQDTLSHWAVFPVVEAKYVQLYVLNNHGASYISVYDFQVYSPQLGGASVPFHDTSTDDKSIMSWAWDFGDGATSSEQFPRHIYTAPGTYTVTLTLTDDDGLTASAVMNYTVLHTPTADFSWTPGIPEEGQTTQVTDTSTDVDGVIVARQWSFSHNTQTPTSASTTTSFPDNGDYPVTLTVTDSQLLTSTVTLFVSTINVPPTINAGSDRTIYWGQDWTEALPGYTKLDATISDESTVDRQTLTVDWDFGDGQTAHVENANTSSKAQVPHVWSQPGVYTTVLTVTDKDGGVTTDEQIVTVLQHGTIQRVYANLTDEDSNEIKVVSKLWNVFKLKNNLEGFEVTFTLGSQTATAVTDAGGFATVYFTGSAGDTVTAVFAGNEWYSDSTATGTVGAASSLPGGDIIFVIDESGSMGDDIAAVKANVANIADQLGDTIDFQLGLVGFGTSSHRDFSGFFPGTPQDTRGGAGHLHSPLSDDISEFDAALDTLLAAGDGEPGFNAIVFATSDAIGYFRSECASCVILITDERNDPDEYAPETKADAIAALQNRNAFFLGIVSSAGGNDYGPNPGSIADVTGGATFDIEEFRSNPDQVLAIILEECARKIIEETSADLFIGLNATPEPVTAGEELTYTITIDNAGPAEATNVAVTNTLSANVTFISAVSSQGACSEVSGTVTCELGALSVNGTAQITVIVVPVAEGSVLTTAAVTTDRFDPDESNNTASITSTVRPSNRAPELGPIGDRTVDEGALLEFTVIATDADGDELTFLADNLPDGASFDPLTRIFSWAPDYDQAGVYPNIRFEVSDGEFTDFETITITVNNMNRAPSAADDSYIIDEDATLTVGSPGVLSNDSDQDGDLLIPALVMDVAHGTLALNTDGSFIYTPAGNFNGVDTFTYRVNDGAVESGITVVTIQVVPVNDAPVAVNDEYSTDEDTSLVIAPPGVLFNDSDTEGDLLSAVLVDDTTHGTLLLENDGSFTYIPDADYNGSDAFTYRAFDGTAFSNVAVVTITVVSVRDRPVAVAGGPYSANEGSSVTFNGSASYAPDGVIAAYDWEFGDGSTGAGPSPQHVYIEEGNYSVTLTVTDNEGLIDKSTTFVTVNDLGPMAAFTWFPEPQTEGASITFTDQSYSSPDGIVAWYWEFGGLGSSAGQNPTFTFLDNGIYMVTLTVTDDDGSTGSISHDVTVVDLGPVAVVTGDTSLDENQTGIYYASGSQSSPDPIVSFEWDWDYNGNFSPSDDTGAVQSHAWSDAGVYTVAVRVTDDDGSVDLDTLQVTVHRINAPPVADDLAVMTVENVPVAVTLTAIDTDNDALFYFVDTTPSHGMLSGTPPDLMYTPAAGYTGIDTFTYKVSDGQSESNIAVVTVSIVAANHAPDAVDDMFTTSEDIPLIVSAPGVMLNDSDPDGDPLTAFLLETTLYGSIVFGEDGSFTYSPDPDFYGMDVFSYRVSDGNLESNIAIVTISVSALNSLPVADAGGPYTGMAKTPVAFDGSGSTDQDGSIVLYEWDFDSDGSYDYSSPSPAASFTWETAYAGPVTLRVTDNEGATDTDIADVTVTMPVSLADLRSVQYRFGSPAPGYTYAYWPIFEYWQQVRFKNFGEGKAYNVIATITSVPVNTTILDGTVSLGDIEAGASAWSKDTFKMRIDMANPQGPNECYWWRVEYDDEFGNHHVIENVRQLPL